MTQNLVDDTRRWLASMDARLGRIELMVRKLAEAQPAKAWYTVREFYLIVDLETYTVREHCRLGRIRAERTRGGRGNRSEYRISHAELLRYQAESLLPEVKPPTVDKPR